MEEKNYLVSGMHCAGCAAKVERAVEGLEGVERVELNLLTGKMTVLFEKPDSSAMERIAPVVEKAGFRLADWKEEPERRGRKGWNRRKRAAPASFGPFCCWFL
mgnify:CR=1 FL=1